ncbi:MAG: GNAT family N-acetyltransferase [Flavobacterium sp.]|uniref:GNAT family N-acetyltransferase n=1 Tax=Flavobacterium sp. TaxID=239 RepID=UPI000CAB9078|nr:GNAT family N-acetyltransferase [Flavobacterium sp.]MBA4134639.1 GNAT family N-acetyltransferase [Flavobacterium sp.]PJE42248.1 MAG: GNAT family N-acetyltransferase [Flavobacterium sp.] [Flavobacterium sp. FEMGT703F]
MITLKGSKIYLRALEPEDLEFVYAVENNEAIWEVSNTQTPYSRFLIRQYLENAHQDIYEAKQLRLGICKNNSADAIGLIDLFDFDPKNKRTGVGIIIQDENDRHSGYGKEALGLVIDYAFNQLQLHQLYANISTENSASLSLFTTFGFEKIGVKKDWNFTRNRFHDEALFQLIKK